MFPEVEPRTVKEQQNDVIPSAFTKVNQGYEVQSTSGLVIVGPQHIVSR